MNYGYQTRVQFGPVITPMVKILLIINIAFYALLTIDRTLAPAMSIGLMDTWLSLIPVKVTEDFQIWRVFTYMFLHGRDLFHLLFNMFILWMFGPEIERVLGSKRFLKYYLFTGAGAGLCSLVTNPFDFILVVGASGAMYAIMLAFAIYFPNRKLLLFFIIPVKAKFLVIGLIIFELMLSIQGAQDGIAHMAHVGGALFGYIFLKRKTMGADIKYYILRLKSWWYRRKFKVYEGTKRDKDRNDPWTH